VIWECQVAKPPLMRRILERFLRRRRRMKSVGSE
jgi:hypothetical protein